jgi:hypothetical protein
LSRPIVNAVAAGTAAARKEHKFRMSNSKKLKYRLVKIPLSMLLLSAMTFMAWPQTVPDFSGLWKQDNDRCQPKRNGDVTLRIEQNNSELTVETSISRGSETSGHAVQKYTIDGRLSVSTGADGDEFHTSAAWKGSSLVFAIEEHEDGHILRSQETWSLIESDTTLRRTRERSNGEKQILFYRRQQSEASN